MTEIEEARAEIARLLVERDEARAERDRRIRQKYETDAALRDIEESLRSSLTAAESKLAEVGRLAAEQKRVRDEIDAAEKNFEFSAQFLRETRLVGDIGVRLLAILNSEGREMGKGEE